MENKSLVVTSEKMEVVDGKVIISSEELAAAMQGCNVDLEAEEEAALTINFCQIKS